jgi:hypothetical protein
MTRLEENRIEMIYGMLRDALRVPEFVTVRDLANYYGCNQDVIRQSPWLMPNFGKPDFGERPKKWKWQTFQEWVEETPEERKRQYYATR